MRSRWFLICAAVLLCTFNMRVVANGRDDQFSMGTDAQQQQLISAAKSLYKIFDSGHYVDSWKFAGPLLVTKTTPQAWASFLESARAPLGKRGKSKLIGYGFHTYLADAPPGQYGTIAFETDFANIPGIQEKFVFQLVGKEWKLAGYFLSKRLSSAPEQRPDVFQ